MKTPDCAREHDLLEALAAGRWPDGGVTALRAHVDGCRSCADLLSVALPLLQEQERAQRDARVPPSGAVWWRAQMRARRESVAAATRPIAMTQRVALACAAGLVAGMATVAQPAVRAWLAWGAGILAGLDPRGIDLARLQAFAPIGLLPAMVVGLLLLVAPIAIYLAAGDE